MDKYRSLADATEECVSTETVAAARSVHQDFSALIEVFDRQLGSSFGVDDQARTAILRARAAAERGLQLSKQLVGLLGNSPPRR